MKKAIHASKVRLSPGGSEGTGLSAPSCFQSSSITASTAMSVRTPRWLAGIVAGAFLSLGLSLQADVTVDTLGGGPVVPDGPFNGYQDGETLLESQFNHPAGLALNGTGNLFVADRDNHAIRRLDLENSLTRTYLEGLNQPVAVAFDRADFLYVATAGDGRIHVFDDFGNPVTYYEGFDTPMAIDLDGSTNIYVAEWTGAIKRISPAGDVSVLAAGLAHPQGLAVMDDGRIAISVEHAILMLDPSLSPPDNVQFLAGSDTAGFADGAAETARFNHPARLAKAGNNVLVVADTGNHRVRMIEPTGRVTTIYGVSAENWFSNYPGWEDGNAEFAEAREPVGVAVSPTGTIYVSEVYYHLIRAATGANLTGTGGTGEPGEPVQITPPTLTPNSGYYPNGIDITVGSPNTAVFYTTDGTDPTTNSLPVDISNNKGTIQWNKSTTDLTALRVAAFVGTNRSDVVSGVPSPRNELGITRDVEAGIGSTAVIPVVVNLLTNQPLRSLQFRVEVTPGPDTAEMITDQFRAISFDYSKDFIPLATGSKGGNDEPARFSTFAYQAGTTRGLGVSYIGTNANLSLNAFGVAALLAVPIPFEAQSGDAYTINVLQPSGTSDGQQTPVPITAMAPRTIRVTNPSYIVGDSSPGTWYNAGEFGDGNLDNADVNNAFAASLGENLPYVFSDVYDAMDVFPEDTPGVAGGDGDLRFLDWQIILFRSLRLDLDNWSRHWGPGGFRIADPVELRPPARFFSTAGFKSASATGPGTVWYRQASLCAGSLDNVDPADVVTVPISVKIMPGELVSGLQFRVSITPENGSPSLTQKPQFLPGPEIPAPGRYANLPLPEELGLSWDLGAFSPPLEGEVLLGHLQFTVPLLAQSNDRYVVRFSRADGAPPRFFSPTEEYTQYEFESLSGGVHIQSAGSRDPMISEEWLNHFFDGPTDPLAGGNLDADGDGVTNLQEYLAGTHPLDADSRLALHVQRLSGADPADTAAAIRVRWLSAPGKTYRLERADDLLGASWTPIAEGLVGTGDYLEFVDGEGGTATAPARFYRIELQP